MSERKLAYICSPYRGSAGQIIKNIEYARELTKKALEMGFTPITPHLYLTQVLNDEIPSERKQGLEAGHVILQTCETMIIGTRYGISEGMAAEIEAGKGKNKILIAEIPHREEYEGKMNRVVENYIKKKVTCVTGFKNDEITVEKNKAWRVQSNDAGKRLRRKDNNHNESVLRL